MLNDLLIIMRILNVTLLLFQNIVIKKIFNIKIFINLLFATVEIVDRLIFCDVIHEMKNSFDYLFIDTIFNLRMQEKLKQRFKPN